MRPSSFALLLLLVTSCATSSSPDATPRSPSFDEQWNALLSSTDPKASRERFHLAVSELKKPGAWQPATKRDAVIHQSDRDARAAMRDAPNDLEFARDLVEFKVRVGSRPAVASARCHLAALEQTAESWRACGHASMGVGRKDDVARAHCQAAVLNPTPDFVRPCLDATREVPSLMAAAPLLCELGQQDGATEALHRCMAVASEVDPASAKGVAMSLCGAPPAGTSKTFARALSCADALRRSGQVNEAIAAYREAFAMTQERAEQFRVFERVESTSTTPHTELANLAPELVAPYQEWKRKNEEQLRDERRLEAERELRRQEAATRRKEREEDLAVIRKACDARCSAEGFECMSTQGAGSGCARRKWNCERACSAFSYDAD